MPPGGATLDESTVPLGQRGDFRGGGKGKPSHFGAARPPSLRAAVAMARTVADELAHPTTPAVAAGHGITSSTKEGSLSSMDLMKGRRHEDSIKEW